jgi:hypothetical protein
MGKWVAAEVLDAALQRVAGATGMFAVSGQPTSYAEALAGKLAEAALAAGDFLLAPGDLSGRKVTVAGKSEVSVTGSGVADHVALVDTVGSRLLYVTTCPAQAVSVGGTVSFDPWSVEIGAPA